MLRAKLEAVSKLEDVSAQTPTRLTNSPPQKHRTRAHLALTVLYVPFSSSSCICHIILLKRLMLGDRRRRLCCGRNSRQSRNSRKSPTRPFSSSVLLLSLESSDTQVYAP